MATEDNYHVRQAYLLPRGQTTLKIIGVHLSAPLKIFYMENVCVFILNTVLRCHH